MLYLSCQTKRKADSCQHALAPKQILSRSQFGQRTTALYGMPQNAAETGKLAERQIWGRWFQQQLPIQLLCLIIINGLMSLHCRAFHLLYFALRLVMTAEPIAHCFVALHFNRNTIQIK